MRRKAKSMQLIGLAAWGYAAICAFWSIKTGTVSERTVRLSAFVLLIGSMSVTSTLVWLSGLDVLRTILPLHLCSLGMFAVLGRAVYPSPEADEFLFAAALPGAAAALIFPGWTALPAESILSVHSFSFHILLAAAAILPLSAGEIRPDVRRLPGCAVMLAAMLPLLDMLNRRFGTNFFFLTEPGEGNPLAALASLGGIAYAAVPILCCAAVWAAMYGAQNFLRCFTPRRGCAIIK